jgi:organic hydroperoxide reductase OsmC/OhrA
MVVLRIEEPEREMGALLDAEAFSRLVKQEAESELKSWRGSRTRCGMSRTAIYHTTVQWKGEHRGRIEMGNGPEMDFSAPPDVHRYAGVLTPEDAFVAAVNTCVMMMFIWSAERFKLDLVAYECRAEGTKLIELDRTEIFTRVTLRPRIVMRADTARRENILRRLQRALDSAVKYSLVASSIKSKLVVEPEVETVSGWS